MEEVWRNIEGYEDIFQISSFGRIRSFKCNPNGRVLKLGDNCRGYKNVRITHNKKKFSWKIHQLVAIAFLGFKPCGMKLTVNHKDFNRQNNHAENLEIVTSRENGNQKHRASSSQYTGVCWDKSRNKWIAKIYINRVQCNLGRFESEYEAHLAYERELAKLI